MHRFLNMKYGINNIVIVRRGLLLVILSFSCLLSCRQNSKEVTSENKVNSTGFSIRSQRDTLPNGKLLLDNLDSGMILYYKEVVGSDTLKGGYITCYGADSMKYFYLRHGDTLHLLRQQQGNASAWGLGILEKDFGEYFLTMIDNGNGVRPTYQLFEKRTGKNRLGNNMEASDYRELGGTLFLLSIEPHGPNDKSGIVLFNTKTSKKEFFSVPGQLPDLWQVEIVSLSRNKLTVEFTSAWDINFDLTRDYPRY